MKQIITFFLLMAAMLLAVADNGTYVPMIREGRVWEYNAQYFHPGENGHVLHYMRFNGTVEVNGIEYHCFEMYKSRYYKEVDFDYENHCCVYEFSREEERGYPKFLLREEPGKVYALTNFDSDDGEWIVHVRNEKEMAELSVNGDRQFGEYLLYDFTMQEGDLRDVPEWEYVGTERSYKFFNLYPFVVATEMIEGELCRMFNFVSAEVAGSDSFDPESSYWKRITTSTMVEGIGIVMNGCLARFNFDQLAAMFQDESYLPDDGSALSYVYDSEGNVIYSPWSSTVGMDNITDTSKSQSGEIYDLMGRRVERVQPGSVYIRDGKKFVGR